MSGPYHSNLELIAVDWLAAMRDQDLDRLAAVEIIGAGDRVVMAVRGPDLERVGEERVGGQVCEVFTIRNGLVAGIRQYPTRTEALAAAGISEKDAAWR